MLLKEHKYNTQTPPPPPQFLYSFLLQIKPSSCPWGVDGRNGELDAKGFLCSLGSWAHSSSCIGHRGSSHPSLPRLAFPIHWLGNVCLSQTQI